MEIEINTGGDPTNPTPPIKPIVEVEPTVPPTPPIPPTESPVDEPIIEQVDIDGVVYSLDKDGNAIDDNNVIKYSAKELKEFAPVEEESEVSELENIMKLTNIIPVDENNNPIVYDSTPEGISRYANDVYELGNKQGIAKYEEALFGTYPILLDVINHLANNNGSLDNFTPTVNYADIQLDPNNEEQLKNIIYDARSKRGESIEKIDKYYNYLKDAKSVFKEAEEELQYLSELTANERTANESAIKAKEQAEIQAAVNYWGVQLDAKGTLKPVNVEGSIYDIINKGKLKIGNEEYSIPDKIRINDNGKITYATRNDFFAYLYEPVQMVINNQKITMTRHDYDVALENNKRSTHDDVFDAFKRFVKYDTTQFIKEAVAKKEVAKTVTKLTTGNKRVVTPEKGEMEIIVPKTN